MLSLLLILAGIGKLTGFSGTVGYITSVGLPAPTLAAAFALSVEIIGGTALLLGFCTRFAAMALAVFTLVASFFFHNFWAVPEVQAFMQQLLFYKNIAVVGGLLNVAAWGCRRLEYRFAAHGLIFSEVPWLRRLLLCLALSKAVKGSGCSLGPGCPDRAGSAPPDVCNSDACKSNINED